MWFSKNNSVSLKNPKIVHKNGQPEVNNWVISQFILKKIIPIVGVHPYPLTELHLLVSAVAWSNPVKIIEWGTHIGVAARIFSETLTNFGIKGTIYSIDLPDEVEHGEHPHKNRGMLVKNKENVVLIQGDGISEARKILKSSKGKGVLFFLDGDHSYKSVKRELSVIGREYPQASIIGHDTFYQEETSKYNIGPHIAFSEFIKKYPSRYYCISTTFGLPGMTLLLPKK